MHKDFPTVLCFNHHDPSSGTGVTADALTLAALNCHPLSIVTAITTQDSVKMDDMMLIEVEWIEEQARLILEDIPVAAFKVGTVGSIENLATIASIMADYPDIPLVLEPVFIAEDGRFSEELARALYGLLLPGAEIIVLNSTQARAMATEDMTLDEIARDILQECQHVLMTGTHENTVKIINRLYDQQDKIVITEWERIPGHFHGRSNTLSAALAGMLAQGLPMEDAVKAAQAYTWQALKHSYRLGMGKYFLKQSIDFLPE